MNAEAPTHSLRGVLIQSGAMLLDAYRELNAKKLFWITMALSGLTVAAFAAVGFDEQGFSIFGKSFHNALINTTFVPRAQLYKNLFVDFGVQWWLGYFGIILALVSTAPMFPDFVSSGAVDLYLARPIGRVRLFLTKYLVGLLFVAVQVFVFTAASIVVIGVRSGAWVPGLFLAVPTVVLLFSYLWSVCALVGTVTRSTIAALLLTLLAWFGIFAVHAGETTLLAFSVGSRVEQQDLRAQAANTERDIEILNGKPASTQPKSFESARLFTLTKSLDATRERLAKADDPFAVWHTVAYVAKWPLPKTAETTKLMERWLDRQFRPRNDRDRGDRPDREPEDANRRNFFENRRLRQLTEAEVDRILRSRSATWVIGTSLLFEATVLGIATLVFVRRDY